MKHQYKDVNALIKRQSKIFEYEEEDKELIKDLRKAYEIFLSGYYLLNDYFELKKPLEIYALFTMLLNAGYLSFNKTFISQDDDAVDIFINDSLNGVNVLNGQAVCRHTSSLLRDIYKKLDFDSRAIGCYMYYPKYGKEHLKRLKNFYDVAKIFGIKDTLNVPFIESIANHSIVEVNHDKKYYFDSLNGEILVPKNVDRTRLGNTLDYEVSIAKNDDEKDIFSSFSEYLKEYKKVKSIYHNNKDIFDNYYSCNNDIYNYVNDKIRVLKKKGNNVY